MYNYRISVIIPSYKPGDYLWQCLDSLRGQTLAKSDFEVILVLNGCKEPYETRIKAYLSDSGLHYTYIQLDEGGVSNARNIGIEKAQGEFIAFIDDDDYVSPPYLEQLLAVSTSDTVGLCRPIAFSDANGEEVPLEMTTEFDKKSQNGKQKFYLPKKLFAGPCIKLIHRDIIGDVRFDKRFKNSEDSLFIFAISKNVKWADFTTPEAIYYRRFREGSAVTTKRSLSNKFMNAFNIICEETKIYTKHFPQYNLIFFVTRILGALRGALID